MPIRGLFILVLVLMAPGAAVTAQVKAPLPAFRLIVNPQNSSGTVDRKFVADAFLKKVTRWGDLEAIRPVDQAPGSSVRRAFSEEVVRRSVAAVKNYWQQLVFSGRDIPPLELDSDQAVVAYVAKFPGAIGYVSASATLQGVKVVEIK